MKLNNGQEINQIALGTFRSQKDDAYKSVLYALKAGYRHIDTASIYGNEEEVGRAIKDSDVPREEIFVTTKIWNSDQGYEEAKNAFQKSLDRLGMAYVDMLLIHWPKSYEKTRATWKAMEELYDKGLVKAIGVSNFKIHDIENLLEVAKVTPAVNQIECHIGLQNHRIKEYMDQHGMLIEAYAPLMSNNIKMLLENEDMQKIADKHSATIPQIAIAWLLQRGIIVLPKSVKEERVISNFKATEYTLDDEDMAIIRKMNNAQRLFPDSDNIDF